MQNPIYLLSGVASVCAMYLIWSVGLRPVLLYQLREKIFDLRFRLFRLAMNGDLQFDSDAYRDLETLFNGLLRFGHRVSFMTYLATRVALERAQKEKDYVSVSAQISLKVSRLSPEMQKQIGALLAELNRDVIRYLAFSSLFFLAIFLVCHMLDSLRIIHIGDQGNRVTKAIEREAFLAETRRSPKLAAA